MPVQLGPKTNSPKSPSPTPQRQSWGSGARMVERASTPLTFRIADLQPNFRSQTNAPIKTIGKKYPPKKGGYDFTKPGAPKPGGDDASTSANPQDDANPKIRVATDDQQTPPEEQPYRDVGTPTASSAQPQQSPEEESPAPPQQQEQQQETYEEEPAPQPQQVEPSSDGSADALPYGYYGNEDVDVHFVSSHVCNGCLNTIAICETDNGYVPVATAVPIAASRKMLSSMHGAVQFGIEHPILSTALDQSMEIIMAKAINGGGDQKIAAAQLVERARQGDQNAMGIIAMVRENAKKGSMVARKAFVALKEYIDRNPVGKNYIPSIGAEYTALKAHDPKNWASIWFANGPDLTNTMVRSIVDSFGEDSDRRTFLFGVMDYTNAIPRELARFGMAERQLLEIGASLGEGRAIQKVRMPDSVIGDYCAVTGWELGE